MHAREIEEIVQPVRTGENGRAAAQPVVAQVAAHLASGVDQRLERIHLRLHPEELGGVDVELRFDADRSVNVSISVEKPETYELLQRESRHLTRLLQESGVDLRNDIDLSMQRQDGGQHGARQQGWNGDGRNARDDASPVPSSRAAPTPSSAAPLPGRSGNRLFDLRI
ncbi:MAG: flagellar hook-length control protein FliK [Geminicoccaceae bacterium]|nr:flagellar hook-length control protein FliK [Geminicoccaceae bacterium]